MIKVHLNTIFRKGHRVVLHFRNRKGGKYRGAFLLAENDDLASKQEAINRYMTILTQCR